MNTGRVGICLQNININNKVTLQTTTTTTTIVLRSFVWDYSVEIVPEETLTHPSF